jgi:PHP family Zn ribbon phosphoesterase
MSFFKYEGKRSPEGKYDTPVTCHRCNTRYYIQNGDQGETKCPECGNESIK